MLAEGMHGIFGLRMPLKFNFADGLGVATICFVALFVLLGLFCILYSFYFRSQMRAQGFIQLNYFSGPWIIRIICIFISIWWGAGEIIRLNLLKLNGRVLDAIGPKWQENVCKCYIVSNLGFAEPCLFLTLVFLLRASLQRSGALSRTWNLKTTGLVLLYCFPVFLCQLVVIIFGPKYKEDYNPKLPLYFIKAAVPQSEGSNHVALCTYPLLSTICLGLFATVQTAYVLWLGRRILHLVINKGLKKRVYTMIFSISSLFPLRVLLLAMSVRYVPGKLTFDAISFLSFLSILCCAGVGICVLVYLPITDSLSLRSLQGDIEVRGRTSNDCVDDTVSLISSQSHITECPVTSPRRESSSSSTGKSFSFGPIDNDGASETAFVELSLFIASEHSSPPESPRHLGWPMIPPAQGSGLWDHRH